MSTLAREPRTRRFCSTTATMTRGLTSGCQPKRRLDSKQIRRVASRFYWTSTTAAVTASAIREPNRLAVQRMYSLLCSGNSAIRSFSRQNRNLDALPRLKRVGFGGNDDTCLLRDLTGPTSRNGKNRTLVRQEISKE